MLNVIDEKTILIFDEMLMNEHWEEDEYRALVEFCERQKLRFRGLAVCLFCLFVTSVWFVCILACLFGRECGWICGPAKPLMHPDLVGRPAGEFVFALVLFAAQP